MRFQPKHRILNLNAKGLDYNSELEALEETVEYGQSVTIVCDGGELSHLEALDLISRIYEWQNLGYEICTQIRAKASGANLIVFFAGQSRKISRHAEVTLKPYLETMNGVYTSNTLKDMIVRIQKNNGVYSRILANVVMRTSPRSRLAKENSWFDLFSDMSRDGEYLTVDGLKSYGLITTFEVY